jgi:DNA repair protein RecO (recombination protein O)
MLKKDHAVCIRTVDYSETSQIVTLFTKEAGKITAIAKGSKRTKSAFDGPIEILSRGEIVYTDSNKEALATLTEFQQQLPFQFPSRDLYTLNCSLLAAELLNNLTDDYDPHPLLFDIFMQFLENLDESRDTLALIILFEFSLLKEIGLQPIFDHCPNCKTKNTQSGGSYYFSSEVNGLICRDCEGSFPDKITVSRSVANALFDIKSLINADEKTLNETEKLLVYHFTNITGKKPKMAKYVLSNK